VRVESIELYHVAMPMTPGLGWRPKPHKLKELALQDASLRAA
jgi:hypothetical protein